MFEKQEIITIQKEDLAEKVLGMREEGYRLVQIGCTPLAEFQMDYSFDREGEFVNFRFTIPREGAELPSITDIYLCAFAYENEIHDLFGINVIGIAIDYAGNFYRTKTKPPMPPPANNEDNPKPPINLTAVKE
jgi:ech hydrogenase subunit D